MSESYTASRRRRGTTSGTQQSLPSVGVSGTGNVWADPTVADSVDLTFRLAPPYAQIIAPATTAAGITSSATTPATATVTIPALQQPSTTGDQQQQQQHATFDIATAQHHQPAASRSASAVKRRVFVEQQGGTFLHVAADRAAKRQRSEQANQELWVATNAGAQSGAFGPGWANSDDARLFAHFLARVVVRLNHFKRTVVALAAGVSLCMLLVLFKINANADAFTATPISATGSAVIANATAVVGAYGGHCDAEVQAAGECTTLLLLANIYKWSSYFHHAVTMVCCVLALLAFAADCALASSSRVAVFSTAAALPKPTASPLVLPGGGSVTSTEDGGSVGGLQQQQQLQNRQRPKQYTAVWRLIGRHLVASSFPFLAIAFCATFACESVELGRRAPREIVTLPRGLAQRQIIATVLRAACLIAAWMVGVVFHSFSDQTILDEIVHHDSVESLSPAIR